jgi:hypothetical protein
VRGRLLLQLGQHHDGLGELQDPLAELVDLLVQQFYLEFRLHVDAVVLLSGLAINVLLPVLAHHDNRRRVGGLERKREIEKNERVRVQPLIAPTRLAVIQTIRIALWTMMKLHDPMTVATASAILCPVVRRAAAGGSFMARSRSERRARLRSASSSCSAGSMPPGFPAFSSTLPAPVPLDYAVDFIFVLVLCDSTRNHHLVPASAFRSRYLTSTPFQKATWSLMFAAAVEGSG